MSLNILKQSGSEDCGLFAIAYITLTAFGVNPGSCVFQLYEGASPKMSREQKNGTISSTKGSETIHGTKDCSDTSILLLPLP